MHKRKSSGFGETIRTVVIAVLIAFAVRTFAYEPFNIPSGSMIPTLLVGDYLFVSKFSYGYSRYSIAFGLPLFQGRIFGHEPERGDVVVFKLPSDPSKDYIKRLIGMPGERIRVVEGVLYINGEPVQRRRITDYELVAESGGVIPVPRYVETLPNGRQYDILEARGDASLYDNTREFIVPEGQYFFMGDNRDRSLDSRTTDVGFVPAENLVGRAEFIWFSLSDNTRFWEIWEWPFHLRFGRLFSGVN